MRTWRIPNLLMPRSTDFWANKPEARRHPPTHKATARHIRLRRRGDFFIKIFRMLWLSRRRLGGLLRAGRFLRYARDRLLRRLRERRWRRQRERLRLRSISRWRRFSRRGWRLYRSRLSLL